MDAVRARSDPNPRRRGVRRGKGRLLAALLLGVAAQAPAAEEDYAAQRRELVAELRGRDPDVAEETGHSGFDARVLAALATVPRERFVPAPQRPYAYLDQPLPIGYGQTISQPFIVALMTDLLRPRPGQRVLEVGTGSGYQAAVLAGLVEKVYSVEIVPPLARQAAERLTALGYANVQTRLGDGYYGWPEHAPFDGIVVTAAASSIPPPLIAQLKPGGRMLIPVGVPYFTQNLMLVEKREDGRVRSRQILPVRFVPLTGGHE